MKKTIVTITIATILGVNNAMANIYYEMLPDNFDSANAYWEKNGNTYSLQKKGDIYTNVIDENKSLILLESVDLKDNWKNYIFNKQTKELIEFEKNTEIVSIVDNNKVIGKNKQFYYLNNKVFAEKNKKINKLQKEINYMLQLVEPNSINVNSNNVCISPDFKGNGVVLCKNEVITPYVTFKDVKLQYTFTSGYKKLQATKTFINTNNLQINGFAFINSYKDKNADYYITKKSNGIGATIKYHISNNFSFMTTTEKNLFEKNKAITASGQSFVLKNKKSNNMLTATYKFNNNISAYVNSDKKIGIGFKYKF